MYRASQALQSKSGTPFFFFQKLLYFSVHGARVPMALFALLCFSVRRCTPRGFHPTASAEIRPLFYLGMICDCLWHSQVAETLPYMMQFLTFSRLWRLDAHFVVLEGHHVSGLREVKKLHLHGFCVILAFNPRSIAACARWLRGKLTVRVCQIVNISSYGSHGQVHTQP